MYTKKSPSLPLRIRSDHSSPFPQLPTKLQDLSQWQARLDEMMLTLSTQPSLSPPQDIYRHLTSPIYKDAYKWGRDLIRKDFEQNGGGLLCARRLSAWQDQLIILMSNTVCSFLERVGEVTPSPLPWAVVAYGGYGRGTLAPGSDIDLLFLLPDQSSPAHAKYIELMLQSLWDLHQKVGYATRNIKECLELAQEDTTICTSLLEARFVTGNQVLFNIFEQQFRDKIMGSRPHHFVVAKLAERDRALAHTNQSRYLVEPNVKMSKGSLRDLNTLHWIATYVYGVSQPEDLIAVGLYTRKESRLFTRCEEFLWNVRCTMHFLTGRATDRLSFDLQREVADHLGYKGRSGLSYIEQFMKHYFLIAKKVGDLTTLLCTALEARQTKPPASLDRTRDAEWPLFENVHPGIFGIEAGRLTILDKELFHTDARNILRFFWMMDQHQIPPHPDGMRLITQSLRQIDYALQQDKEANKLFLDILTSHHNPELVLRLMNESGVLGHFIPDFGRIVAMMQFNMYHHYTVDEHLLQAMGILSAIESGRLAKEHPVCTELFSSVTSRTALYVAVFLHDIAKGRPTDHSIEGALVARKLCPRFGLTPAETEMVVWLIEHHLDMSDIAQRRDLSELRTIQNFAKIVQSLEYLRMLIILTVCDIRAVGPGVWNGWKGQLLRKLYAETELLLAGGHSPHDLKERVEAEQDALRKDLPDWSDEQWTKYVTRHNQAYWLKVSEDHKIRHARLLHEMDITPKPFYTYIQTDRFRNSTEITLVAPDQPLFLARITGACAMVGADIMDAHIFTTQDGMVLDTIFLARAFVDDVDEERRANKIIKKIDLMLHGQLSMPTLENIQQKAQYRYDAQTFHVPPNIMIDNHLSSRYTVVEASGLDRHGLLFELTSTLSSLDLNICSAHIVTFGEKAVDAFYVTDLAGHQITESDKQQAIRQALLKVLEQTER